MDLSSQVGLRPEYQVRFHVQNPLGGMDLSSQVGLRPFLEEACYRLADNGGMDLSSQVGLRLYSAYLGRAASNGLEEWT